MYSFFRGKVDDISDNKISLDVNNVGYEINMPTNEIENINLNQEIKVYTYLQVKEDDMKLFGFIDKKSLEFFKKLILVNGVGPKVALGIIGNINAQDMCVAIAKENIAVLKSIPGVGPKMAQKIIFELKDKILKEQLEDINEEVAENKNEVLDDAITALQVLGYNLKQIKEAISDLDVENDDVETIIKKVLNKMQRNI